MNCIQPRYLIIFVEDIYPVLIIFIIKIHEPFLILVFLVYLFVLFCFVFCFVFCVVCWLGFFVLFVGLFILLFFFCVLL